MANWTKYIYIASLCLLGFYGQGQEVLSPRIANYFMDVQLDPDKKKLSATTDLIWYNPSQDTIGYVLLHLYYNAFRNSRSTFFKERGVPEFLTQDIDEECGWGWSHIISVKDGAGNDLTAGMEYIAPDDGNKLDRTVIKIPLAKTIWGEENVTLRMEWEAKIPKTMPRTGYNKDFYFFAQWFPKIGVYEPAGMRYRKDTGAWNCHQYHSSGEYYADFGVYDIKLHVPKEYIIAASGQLQEKKENGELNTWHFIAEDVIDFTWTASPEYVITKDKYKNTDIFVYTYPEKQYFSERYINTLKFCMAYLEDHLGRYPYPTISVVDPPIHGMFTGGMEYPTLITSLSFESFPAGFKTPETLVVHEFIHQYFMQMVATHEVEEAWMDEGFTTYYEGKILDAYLGDKTSLIDIPGINIGNREWNRGEFLNSPFSQIASNTRKSWKYTHGGYGEISYNKTALWLQTMEGILGEPTMQNVMRQYFQQWQFRHPCRNDFIDIVNQVVKKEKPQEFPDGMDWYFEQVLFGTGLCDYKVLSIENNKVEADRGFFTDHQECEVVESNVTAYKSKVILQRLGDIKVPLDIRLTLEDGKQTIVNWNGKDRSTEIVLDSEQKVISAEIDPYNKISLDKNILNNSLTISKSESGIRKMFARFITGFQHILETVSLFA